MTNSNNTKTIFSQILYTIKILPESLQKAALIDIPTSLTNSFLSKSFPKLIPLTSLGGAASTSYHLRSEIKLFLTEEIGLDKYSAGIIAGLAGGYVRYKLTDQVPLIGAVNNALYETCNNFEFCSNDLRVSSAFTIAVEGIDATAQAFYNSVIEGSSSKSYFSLFIGGAKIGAIVSGFIYALYVPVVTNDFTYLDYLSGITSFGGENKPDAEL